MRRPSAAQAPGQLDFGLFDDARAICAALMGHLAVGQPGAALIQELGIGHGAARIDLVAVADELHGFEIKSRRDDLRRLRGQASAYELVFDRLFLVIDPSHSQLAESAVPTWWGILIAEPHDASVVVARDATPNPNVDPHEIARLLWHDELRDALSLTPGESPAASSSVLRRQLVSAMAEPQLRELVRVRLRERPNWRAA